ncbi:MAG TPA: pyridoxamine 5'-phosphate oxidase, partial [Legionellales bacterium]|nr:pyridoxamine 5'-phosphate oxidase [Legionellales bacterium]
EQSKPLASRTVLEKRIAQLTQTSEHTRPTNWGGYQLSISEIEFWQGRDDRAHDRIHYTQQQRIWHHQRLFP